MYPEHLRYTNEHEWLRDDGDLFVIGITDHAAELLGDVTYVELLGAVGTVFRKGDEVATVESVKAASEVYAPVGGTVVAVNEDLVDAPELINKDPYGAGWFFKIEGASAAEADDLMDAVAYQRYVAENV
ncbi:MAG TPA: glycine cleavage system protein GcvH [Candidatus Hydrogenedentes bacterium]|nr:glycine cleavage system protein GcvH [Candidatus Hydrogenedentota bacterium]HPG69574.1 glycine cleavage system protein GcvH [Candidatus Hydrogenedentota bacterium]